MSEEREVQSQPGGWRGPRARMLEALMWVREEVRKRHSLWLVTGSETVDSLLPFIHGFVAHVQFNGGLRDVKKEFPGEGWHVKYLRDCQGDHRRAVLKFLDFVDEYVSLRAAKVR